MTSDNFFIRFWGVRGSLPCPGVDFAKVGGNTPCLEIRCGDHMLVFDAGTGIHPLGRELVAQDNRQIDLLFTHCHYDHICGLPFFQPLYCSNSQVRMWSGHHLDGMNTEGMVRQFMAPPFFPVGPEAFAASILYEDFEPGDLLEPNSGIVVKTVALNHPNGCIGYRIEYSGKAICYISDTEHVEGNTDQRICDLIEGADIVIYDAAYTSEEYDSHRGFGHSTWREGARLCDLANAGRYVTFHHCPSHEDAFMADLEKRIMAARPGSMIAREGLVLHP